MFDQSPNYGFREEEAQMYPRQEGQLRHRLRPFLREEMLHHIQGKVQEHL